ncbi:MAG: hypothetical protein GY751_26650 [Bacteroidetes bacterium]|nr:hypothetical protein [Bacteroidota bacterium]
MIVRELDHLKEEDKELVMRTPALISVLIGGADGDFDGREKEQAVTSVHFRAKQGDKFLKGYYKAVDLNFQSVMLHIAQKFEGDVHKRTDQIIAQLEELNNILPKLDRRFAEVLLADWRNLAYNIGKASGGFLGYARLSHEESHLVELKMITYRP